MPTLIGRRTRNPVLLPQNRGLSQIAQRRLEQMVGQANRATQEAIDTDGYLVRIWRRQRGSIRCTCNQNFQLADPPDLSNEMLADDPEWSGDTNERTFDRITSPPPLGTGPLGSVVLRDSHLPYDEQQIPNLPQPETLVTEGSQNEYTGEEYDFEDTDFDNNELQQRQIGSLQRHILGVQKFRCPICFGTSYTDTYNFASGYRYLFDASGFIDFSLEQVSINMESVPHQFELSGPEDAVVWTIQFPTFFETVSAIRIFDVFDPAQGVHAEFKEAQTNDQWLRLTPEALIQLRGQSKTLLIRVVPSQAQLDNQVTFTHLEVVYETTKLPRAQIPQLNRNTTLFSFEDILSVDCEIDPKVGFIRKESVLEVISQGSLWKIGNTTNKQTAGKQLFGYQLEMTLIQGSEQVSIIRVQNSEQLRPLNANYAGLETIQGQGIAPVVE